MKSNPCVFVEALAPFVVYIKTTSKTVPALVQVRDIGSGNFGVAKLMKDKQTGQLVAVKFIERGDKVSAHSFSCLFSSFLLRSLLFLYGLVEHVCIDWCPILAKKRRA